jgi:hypothetical protein
MQTKTPTMATSIQKEWAAVDGDEIILRADTKESLQNKIQREGRVDDDLEIVAIPTEHTSMFV